jgi:uracil-DNA glycosylase family 4
MAGSRAAPPVARTPAPSSATAPSPDCPLCPRLAGFRAEWRDREPGWHNAPVSSFLPGPGLVAGSGADSGRADGPVGLLVVGLAPGLRGANRTGRPFTGDYAGDLLYRTLGDFGFSRGTFAARPDDGLTLVGAAVTNAVRCVPPENKPLPAEIAQCRPFLAATLAAFPDLKAIVALGRIAHDSTVRALGRKLSAHPFGHGAEHDLGAGVILFDSYHCSRYNTNTGVLTEPMFRAVFARVRDHLAGGGRAPAGEGAP